MAPDDPVNCMNISSLMTLFLCFLYLLCLILFFGIYIWHIHIWLLCSFGSSILAYIWVFLLLAPLGSVCSSNIAILKSMAICVQHLGREVWAHTSRLRSARINILFYLKKSFSHKLGRVRGRVIARWKEGKVYKLIPSSSLNKVILSSMRLFCELSSLFFNDSL